MESAISSIMRTLHCDLKPRSKGMQRLAKRNLDGPGISIDEGEGETVLQLWCCLQI